MPLRYVDPHRKQSRIYRADMRFGRSRAGGGLAAISARASTHGCTAKPGGVTQRRCL
jgi:hypothetical protein